MPEFAVAGAFAVVAILSLWRLPLLHPVQLWAVPWSVVTALYALRLLPYREMQPNTVVLVLAASGAFMLAALLAGGRNDRSVPRPRADPRTLEIAALLLLGLTAVWLGAFLLDVARQFGLRRALISSDDVRLAIGAGATSLTIKYVYAALAATIAAAAAAAMAASDGSGRHRKFLGLALLSALSTYFSTGRSTVVIAAVMAVVAYGLMRPDKLRLRTVALAAAGSIVLALTSFLIVGELQGKTFENSEIATFDSSFSRSPALADLALPYEYVTAPVAAFNELAQVADPDGRTHGCATAAFVCTILHRVGIGPGGEPAIRAFTARPLQWNTYTALDGPLIDGGPVAAILIMALTGALVGSVWRYARRGHLSAVLAYAPLGTATVVSTIQNNYLATHFVAAMLLAMSALALARWRAARPSVRQILAVRG